MLADGYLFTSSSLGRGLTTRIVPCFSIKINKVYPLIKILTSKGITSKWREGKSPESTPELNLKMKLERFVFGPGAL
jgi:hypothetical protein